MRLRESERALRIGLAFVAGLVVVLVADTVRRR
jgi:hypothetical protein